MADLTTYVLATLALIAIGGFVVGGIKGSRVGTKLGVFTTAGLAVLLAGGFTSDGNAAKPESDTNYKATYQHYWLMSCATTSMAKIVAPLSKRSLAKKRTHL